VNEFNASSPVKSLCLEPIFRPLALWIAAPLFPLHSQETQEPPHIHFLQPRLASQKDKTCHQIEMAALPVREPPDISTKVPGPLFNSERRPL
jgi:hypothetical protein